MYYPERAKYPAYNLKKDEILKILIIPADKENATVVVDTMDYEHVNKLFEDYMYKKLNHDPTATWEKEGFEWTKET